MCVCVKMWIIASCPTADLSSELCGASCFHALRRPSHLQRLLGLGLRVYGFVGFRVPSKPPILKLLSHPGSDC